MLTNEFEQRKNAAYLKIDTQSIVCAKKFADSVSFLKQINN